MEREHTDRLRELSIILRTHIDKHWADAKEKEVKDWEIENVIVSEYENQNPC